MSLWWRVQTTVAAAGIAAAGAALTWSLLGLQPVLSPQGASVLWRIAGVIWVVALLAFNVPLYAGHVPGRSKGLVVFPHHQLDRAEGCLGTGIVAGSRGSDRSVAPGVVVLVPGRLS